MDFSVETRSTVAIFRIERPDKANALTRNVLLALGRFAREQGTNSNVRALIVTGAGNRFFCAGADLSERAGWTEEDIRTQLDLYVSELGALDRSPKPVIAALNGLAFGGGLEIALACDLRLAAVHAQFAMPEVSLGIIPGAGGTQRLPRTIGEARAKEMILLGRRVSADQALQWGLLHQISSTDSNVVDEAIDWIQPIISGAPIAQAAALQAIDAARCACDTGVLAERLAYEAVLRSEDRLEGIRAFHEKRKPAYQGK